MATATRKRGFTTWVNLRLAENNIQINNCFVELFKDTNIKMFIESLIGTKIKKLQSWANLSSAQQVTRVEWIVDELKEAGVLKNNFYCEFPALGRGAYDETEWFLWAMVKADLYRVLESTLSYLDSPTLLLNNPFSITFNTEQAPSPPKSKSIFAKSESDLDLEKRLKQEEKATWKARLKPTPTCIDMINKYLCKTKEGRKLTYFSTLQDLKDTRVLLTFVNSLFEDTFTPDIMLIDKWTVNLALEALANILKIRSDFDSEDLVIADNKALCAYLATVLNRALQFKQTEKVIKRLETIEERLTIYHNELQDMSKISMSANESRQKKELLLKVEVLKKEQERLGNTYDIVKLQVWYKDAEAERLRVHSVVAYRLRQRFINEPIKRPVVISNMIDAQYINLNLTNGAAFYTSKQRETVSPNRRIVLYDKKQDLFIEDFSGFRKSDLPTVRALLGIPERDISDVWSDNFEEDYDIYYEALTRNRTLKPGQQLLYQLFPGSQIFLQKVFHKRVKAGDLMTIKKLVNFYEKSKKFIDSKDSLTGNTALHMAIKHAHFHIALYLLEQSASLEISNLKGKTPFFIAAERFDRLTCKLLIEWGADIFTKNSYQKAALDLMNNEKFRSFVISHYQYIRENSINVLNGDMDTLNKMVLDHKYKVLQLSTLRTRCFEGMSAMHMASKYGAIPIIEALSEMGISANIRDNNGASPLHYVHDVATCQVLIEHGANVNAQDNKQDTPMHYLCSGRAGDPDTQIDIAELLANYGANISMQNGVGYMPLHYCAIHGRADYIMLLMQGDEAYVQTMLNSHSSTTPSLTYLAVEHDNLVCARWLQNTGIKFIDEEATDLVKQLLIRTNMSLRTKVDSIKFLLENGADPNAVCDKTGVPVIHTTTQSNESMELLMLLIEHGADVNCKNRLGQTPLFAAVMARNIHAAKLLIDKGASTEIKDKSNKLPFQHLADYSEWISREMLDGTSENLLKQCSLNAERNLVRNISNKIRMDGIKSGQKLSGDIT